MCCTPLSKCQPGQVAHWASVFSGQPNFERIGRGTLTSTPPTASIRSGKRCRSMIATWLTGTPSSRIVRIASGAPPIWYATFTLSNAVPGDLDAQVARDREVRDSVAARIGAHEHDRVRAAKTAPRARAVRVRAQEQHVRRVREQRAVLRHERLPGRLAQALVRRLDAVLDGEVARDRPDDEDRHEHEQDDGDPAAPADAALRLAHRAGAGVARRRPPPVRCRSAGLRSGRRQRRNLALDAAAAVDAVRLVFQRHPAG